MSIKEHSGLRFLGAALTFGVSEHVGVWKLLFTVFFSGAAKFARDKIVSSKLSKLFGWFLISAKRDGLGAGVTVGLGSIADVCGKLASVGSLSGESGAELIPHKSANHHKLDVLRVDFQTRVRTNSCSGREFVLVSSGKVSVSQS